MDTHKFYKEKVESSLSKAIGRNIEAGIWKYTRKDVFGNKETKIIPKGHILPLEDSCKSAAEKRAEAIEKYLGLKVAEFLGPKLKGLHQYSHHLNSSQTLCIQFFSALIEGNYPHFTAKQELVDLLKSIDITIHTGAECKFEYQEKEKEEYKFKVHNQYGKEVIEYEGTSFDFHIKDNDIEVFFEIKFTEDGFGKACKNKKHPENMERHKEKAEQYKKLLLNIPKQILSLKQEPSVDEILMNYQLFRNLIRVGENKYVVFITDEKNTSTEAEKDNFQKKYEKSKNVIFITWQDILEVAISHYPHKLPFQFEYFKLPQEHE